MEHPGEVEVGWQQQWSESEAPDPQLGQCLRVGATAEGVGHSLGVRVLRLQRGAHRVDERPVEVGLQGDVVDLELSPYIRAQQPVDRLEELLLEPGQETAVDERGS